MKNSKLDELMAYETREWIVIHLESFGDEFDRLAKTARQAGLAVRFSNEVYNIATNRPLTATDLEPLDEILKGYLSDFERLARTPEQKRLVAYFGEFISEISGPVVKAAFLEEIHPPGELTGHGHDSTLEKELSPSTHGHATLCELFQEIRMDEEAGKREDAHWYGKKAFQQLLDAKPETPAKEPSKGKGIER